SRVPAPWRPREHAVPADVAAGLRQRDEELGRIGDEPAVTELAKSPGLAREPSPRLGDELEGLDRGESLTHAVSLRAGGRLPNVDGGSEIHPAPVVVTLESRLRDGEA